ncbi:MAG: hypothetical protein AAGJ93_15620 [Bacteroidota bacterium]
MSNKDIFEQIKSEAQNIRETPSPEAWSRIEQRLQADRPSIERGRVRTLKQGFQPMSIAAGLALLLGLSVVFMWMTDQQQTSDPIAQASTLEWEELALTPTATQSTEPIAIAANNPQPIARKPIAEGSPNQKLIAKHDVRPSGTIYNSQADSARNAERRMSR